MTQHRKVAKVGGSLTVFIPRDIAEAMAIQEGTPIGLSLVGRALVVDPADDVISEASYRRALKTVLRRYGPAFQALAEHDADR
jgi:antitoxin component of MazEF toxin-antitoxin module